MRKKKNYTSLTLALFMCLITNPMIKAAEVDAATPYTSSEATNQTYELYPETQQAINDAIALDPGNEEYINNIINLFDNYIEGTSEELNQLLKEALIEAEKVTNEANEELEKIRHSRQIIVDSISDSYGDRSIHPQAISPAVPALALYKAGIQIVKLNNHPQTAKYMEHAIVPTSEYSNPNWKPANYVHNNDAWAKDAIVGRMDLNGQIYNLFYQDIINKGRTYGTVTGDYTYKDGQYASSLHKVTFNATFSQLQDGSGFKVVYKITDKFDFEWDLKGYDQFEFGFANNYCFLVQEMGLIEPFNIIINYAP